jgi:PAS domain S-box-containing protein
MRLVLLVSMALLPALGFEIYAEQSARQLRQQLMEDEVLRLLRLVASEQQRIVEGAEQVLDAISSTRAVQENQPEPCQRLLANLLSRAPRYSSAGVIGLDGHLICVPGPLDRSVDASDRAYFRLALQTGGAVVGEYAVGRTTQQPTIHIAKPFTNRDGMVAGVTYVALSLPWLNQQLERLPLPPKSVVAIVDRNGTFLARSPEGPRFVGQTVPADRRFALEGNEIKLVSWASQGDGRPLVAAYSPPGADPKGFVITLGLDRETLFAAVAKQNRLGLLLILAGVGLALVLAVLIGHYLIRRPLDRLVRVADCWRTGDLAVRTNMREDGSEFGRLAGAFDRMAAAQQVREHALRESEERLRVAMSAARMGVWEFDLVTNVGIWSPEATKIFGRDDASDASFETWFAAIHPDDQAHVRASWDRILSASGDDILIEYRFRGTGGGWRWIGGFNHLVFEAGRAIRLIGVVQDIDARKRIETELRHLTADELRREIGERARAEEDLRRATAVAEEANRELEAFSYSVAHDLRAPLRSIDGFSQALLEDCADKLNDEGKTYLGFVRESAQRMAKLIDDLLSLSRVSRATIQPRPVDLAAMARVVFARLQQDQPGRTVDLVVPSAMIAVGDARLLEIVLENLLGNAWKFTGKRAHARIELGQTTQTGQSAYFVRDDGAGFNNKYADKLFAVFQRLHTESEFKGTGIGLATVQRIIRRHHGRIWAEGEVGHGATFYFTLGERT